MEKVVSFVHGRGGVFDVRGWRSPRRCAGAALALLIVTVVKRYFLIYLTIYGRSPYAPQTYYGRGGCSIVSASATSVYALIRQVLSIAKPPTARGGARTGGAEGDDSVTPRTRSWLSVNGDTEAVGGALSHPTPTQPAPARNARARADVNVTRVAVTKFKRFGAASTGRSDPSDRNGARTPSSRIYVGALPIQNDLHISICRIKSSSGLKMII
ncbi:hypothetical protein EVAR_46302_1 [Eumeta japonica]|uniref:Uncharacterized protein n=1 Tax=Eumeta variegata TaxID=151549 RepID=A0A4C1Y0R3_EUMVA|nr:hypothetical protein EVAR_46302_1 [Eumeta japonica]